MWVPVSADTVKPRKIDSGAYEYRAPLSQKVSFITVNALFLIIFFFLIAIPTYAICVGIFGECWEVTLLAGCIGMLGTLILYTNTCKAFL